MRTIENLPPVNLEVRQGQEDVAAPACTDLDDLVGAARTPRDLHSRQEDCARLRDRVVNRRDPDVVRPQQEDVGPKELDFRLWKRGCRDDWRRGF